MPFHNITKNKIGKEIEDIEDGKGRWDFITIFNQACVPATYITLLTTLTVGQK